ncbi:MAG: ribosome-associated translation inhibitor RaiA [Actinobacteria bacterium]|nr:ribosome-associated translation inhibitor RaiA [Actinomycetota bacterium]
MDLILKGRGVRVTDPVRRTASHKLAKLERLAPGVVRVEVTLSSERNPRLNGTKRIDAHMEMPRRTFRAHAEGPDVEVALDLLVERLERQVRDARGKRRNRILGGGNRLKSPRISPEGAGTAE